MKSFTFLLAMAAMVGLVITASAQSNLVLFISASGDYIGQGRTYVTTNASEFSLSGTPAMMTVTAFGFNFWIGGPGGTKLTTGIYTNSARYPFNGDRPGFDIFGNGRGCNEDCGSFQLYEIHVNSNGEVDRLWLTFTNSCECFMATMLGEIRYNSQLAPPAPIRKTLHVPEEYPTIQAAINFASLLTTDTVLVSSGIYKEALNFNGKSVLMLSENGPTETIINPPTGLSAVSFTSGETTNAIISGFTITNGGIWVSSSSPTIVSNVVVGCEDGINAYFSSPIIKNNSITGCTVAIWLQGGDTALVEGNILQNNQGGIGMWASGNPLILNNLIKDNDGTGISMVNGCDADIVQNIIVGNTEHGILASIPEGARGPYIVNNTIIGNGSKTGSGIGEAGFPSSSVIMNNIVSGPLALEMYPWYGLPPAVIEFNNFYSPGGTIYEGDGLNNLIGTNGNISTNPSFACLPGLDFHLLAGSPCINAGTNGAPLLSSVDYDSNPRILADSNGLARVDMGAFEFNPAFPPTACVYLHCPSNVVAVSAVGENSTVVNYPLPDATPSATVTCLPASGSVFPAGATPVNCTLTYGTNTLTGSFTVTVLVAPFITNQAKVITALANSNVTISVEAIGTAPVSCQWLFNGLPLSNATNSSLTVSNAQAANEGYYQVCLANEVGTTVSSPILLRILASKAAITAGPLPVTVMAGDDAIFNATIIGSAPLLIQWYKDGVLLPGANYAELHHYNAQASDMGVYQLLVSNSLGSVVSPGATLTVFPARPKFVLQPASTAAIAGSNLAFVCRAVGTDSALDPIQYTWYFEGSKIPGQTSSTLQLASIAGANEGSYFAIAANSLGAATSDVARLTVYLPPTIQTGLSNIVVDSGRTVVLKLELSGTPPLGCVWHYNGIQLPSTAASLSLTNIQPSQSGYYSVSVTNQFGTITSTTRVSVLKHASRVIAWGDNSAGQLCVPTNLEDAVAIAGGDYHSIALRHDGTLVAWGYDGDGQTDVPTNSLRFVSIAAGASHNVAILENGSVTAWGRNDVGQTEIPDGVVATLAVAAGHSHSLALLASGTVLVWGDNTYGQINLPPILSPGYWIWTGWGRIWVPNDPQPAKTIAAGGNHNLALLYDGTVAAWGDNNFGQTTVPPDLTNVIAIAAGSLHSVALCSNGRVVAWGDNTFHQTDVPAQISNVIAITAGDFHTLALLANGTVVGWGEDTFGQLDVPPSVKEPVEIASGYYHGLAIVPVSLHSRLTADGLVIQWGGTGVLQWAPTPSGPFADVPAQNSYTNFDISAPTKFFRLRH